MMCICGYVQYIGPHLLCANVTGPPPTHRVQRRGEALGMAARARGLRKHLRRTTVEATSENTEHMRRHSGHMQHVRTHLRDMKSARTGPEQARMLRIHAVRKKRSIISGRLAFMIVLFTRSI